MKRTPYTLNPSLDKSIRILFLFVFFVGLCLNAFGTTPIASAVSSDLVISQVYGGGGNANATYKNDFVEIFNRGTGPVSLSGYQIQYFSSTSNGTNPGTTPLTTVSLAPGKYYLIGEASQNPVGSDLPVPDITGTIAMSASAGSVKLVNTNTSNIIDTVGYGTGIYVDAGGAGSETAPGPTPSAKLADFRADGGCTDTDNNSADFSTTTPNPRNNATTANPCNLPTNPIGTGSATPGVVQPGSQVTLTVTVTPGANPPSTGLSVTGNLTPIGGSPTQVFSKNGTVFTYVATVTANAVDGSKMINFTVSDNEHSSTSGTINLAISAAGICGGTFTHIYDVQGNGAASPLLGNTVTVQGVVTADFEGSSGVKGFYIQDATGDNDATTSDGLFIYTATQNYGAAVNKVVRVTGVVSENFDETELTVASGGFADCGTTGVITPVEVTLPFASADYPERYESMLVTMPQNLYVSETFQLGRFNQVLMSSGDRLRQPTEEVNPGPDAVAFQAANDLNQVVVDDGFLGQNLDPITFSRGTYPAQQLTASNTLRMGDRAQNITGVMTWEWGGAAVSPNAWRIRVTQNPTFTADNPRPTASPAVGGTLKVAGLNLLNFFNDFSGCTLGVGGSSTDCRGANNQAEFVRQYNKTLAAIEAVDADVIAFSEIENNGYGPDSAIQFLVDQLNSSFGAGTYVFINADTATGQSNSLGTDAIKVGILYKPGKVMPVGTTAVLNTGAFGQFPLTGGGTTGRSRPPLAQSFKQLGNNEVFTVVANHLKSKGSGCADNAVNGPVGPDPDIGDGQGGCNLTRKQAAIEEATWLAGDPTGINDPDVLVLGDMNSYAKEDPIKAFETGGYVNLLSNLIGSDAYSYVFDGQSGYLDHALASSNLAGQVTGVAEFHNNADEPTVLDYNTEFKTANQKNLLYAADEYRASDHDPVIVGLNLRNPVLCDPLLVTMSTDEGSGAICGTLSYAIDAAKPMSSGQDVTITLAVSTITVSTNLQVITSLGANTRITIGADCGDIASSASTRTEIKAAAGLNPPTVGLILGSKVTLQGVSVTGFGTSGIEVKGNHNVIACSRVGTSNGSAAAGNGVGIKLQSTSSDTSIGVSDQANSGNLVSGNTGNGIYVEGGSTGNHAYYNQVGFASNGTSVLKNRAGAVKVEVSSDSGNAVLTFGPGNRSHA